MEALVTVEANVVYRRRCDAEGNCVNVEVTPDLPAGGAAMIDAPESASGAGGREDTEVLVVGANPQAATRSSKAMPAATASDVGGDGGDNGVDSATAAPDDPKQGLKKQAQKKAGKGRKRKRKKKKKNKQDAN
jgi:hypothetical protein